MEVKEQLKAILVNKNCLVSVTFTDTNLDTIMISFAHQVGLSTLMHNQLIFLNQGTGSREITTVHFCTKTGYCEILVGKSDHCKFEILAVRLH